ncbi:MAG: DUF423 domain-containing protein [Cytophagales bacterium]|nr:DUF423 domain-containing protein [Bacteroidota bacterium]MBS1982502.1 DUF423 domain-containing protein [Bacteroidota bacterium]WHZ06366.1 MAG: DUF423 domain-containing protein [Cytophagales bacterium]
MNNQQTLLAGALFGTLAVALGAFGAHALKNLLTQNGRTEIYELAVRYHFYHALALLLIGILMRAENYNLSISALLIFFGVILFSGSLYLYALTGIRFLNFFTPVGGVLMLAGWIALAYQVYKHN